MFARLAPWALALLAALTAMVALPARVDSQPIDVHPALAPAWQALTTLRTADGQDVDSSHALIAESTGVRLTVGPLPDGADAGFDPRGRRIIVNHTSRATGFGLGDPHGIVPIIARFADRGSP